ncbi:NAD(P)-dependent dehydrogenase, short-chain alcohol dehydrogenase family [Desulfatibacillum alkenivorans DSM 16219]|jgi:NAD(P)-dependent dehydrogenase (short-subunit alcohol dehydrogenase family)|uniref:NAD(P)-dependent dehydrogenase, short-chain alcohol dehydrogenase family n=1 Tax=Desulfatibacillum alkenivorans DSM 16219 TaxID=1121393 RepID=A0A1M6QMU1_9BACT|nr:RhlG family 3-oxoacyl-ACP reductase [Desulfatibacillum alkenivorans]SHK21572.1 NAD(P)-dependent dehydrogenase, short-chain alcohol dehydrogenase family [Desulfatibacillum alkenivorans DSM 16219]
MIDTLFSMKGKVCLVTGGSRGLGYYMAQGFLEAGAARVYITARKAPACLEAAEELSKFGECIAIPGDVGGLEGIQALAARISEKEDSLDVLVNNAGAAWGAPIDAFPEKGWDKVMDLNVKSPFFMTQAFLNMLRKGKSPENTASVVNIGSIAGIVGASLSSYSYGPSKAAIHQLTRNLAKDLADDHIRVNAIAPGRFFSKMTEYVSKDQAAYAAECKEIPLHRWGSAEDIAGVAVMLCSRAGAYMTGQIVPIDGGSSL